jgi:hypothetical protein
MKGHSGPQKLKAALLVGRFLFGVVQAEEVRQRAMESGQLSAAVATIREKGILSGKRIERTEVGAPGAFKALTDHELERAIVERFTALGLTPDAGSDTRH